MVQLSLFSFIALLEGMAVLLVLLGVLARRLRRMRTERTRIQFIDASEEYPKPSLYLDSEAAKTQSFLEALRAQPGAEPSDPAVRAALGLRAGLLRQESVVAGEPAAKRDSGGWATLAQQVMTVLAREGFSRQVPHLHQIYGEDSATHEAIVAQQTRTIEHLREYLEQLLQKLGHQPLPDDNILQRFDELERANRELNQCIAVLESENSFLRDQIAALLTLEPAGKG